MRSKLVIKCEPVCVCVSQVWKLGWSPRRGGEFGTALPEIPVEFLQEKDVFREFLYRINVLGTKETDILVV